MSIFLALIHHPVLNRHGEVVATAVTNVDLHDIARAGRTYGVEKFFVVTPIALQQKLVGRVVSHWTEGRGSQKNSARVEAFALVELVDDLARARARTEELAGEAPRVVVTGAGLEGDVLSWREARRLIAESDPPLLILFGTGHGLTPEVIEGADVKLPPIVGPPGAGGFNHLSVRAAAAIMLDRLLGEEVR